MWPRSASGQSWVERSARGSGLSSLSFLQLSLKMAKSLCDLRINQAKRLGTVQKQVVTAKAIPDLCVRQQRD
jgi:hypothetical protein